MRQPDHRSDSLETVVLASGRPSGDTPSRLPLLAMTFLAALVAGVVALGAVVALMLDEHITVHSKQELARANYGQPLSWVSQDQSRFDPPFPFEMGFGSPLECPTTVHWSLLGLDVLGVWLALMAVGVASLILGTAASRFLRTG